MSRRPYSVRPCDNGDDCQPPPPRQRTWDVVCTATEDVVMTFETRLAARRWVSDRMLSDQMQSDLWADVDGKGA